MTESKRGGKREGAGRKSPWRSPTKMIRLPAEHEAAIVTYAQQLDSDAKSDSFEVELQRRIDRALMTLKPSQRRDANRLFKKLL